MFDLDRGVVSDPFSIERTVWGDIPFDGVTPPLLESNPLTAADTEVTIPVVMAVIGPVWTTVIIVGAVALIVGVACGVVWLVRRRRRGREAQVPPPGG